jgi:superoxide dismutase
MDDRASCVDTIWNVVKWSDVADRFAYVCRGGH